VKVNESSFGKKDDQGDPTNGHTRAMAIFTTYDDEEDEDGTEHLYVGTFNTTSGCEVWRTDGSLKDGGPEMDWEQVSYGGFGTASADEPDNICVMDMIVFNGDLYAGTYNRDGDFSGGSDDETTWSAGRIFRYAENASDIAEWVKVWDGVVGGSGANTCYALSARCFEVFGGELLVGLYHHSGDDFYSYNTTTGDWDPAGRVETNYVNDIVDLIVYDSDLWASTRRGELQYVWRTDGNDWHKWSRDGFGDDYNKSIYCFGVFKGDLYAATWNTNTDFGAEDGTGCEVWKTTTDATRITLDSFEAVARKDGSILLRWVTGTEIGTAGFDIYRSESPDFESFEKINPRIIEASGTPEAGAEYKVLDRSVDPGTFYYYFLVEIDVNGKMSTFGPVQARAKIPVPEVFEMYSAIIQMDTFGV